MLKTNRTAQYPIQDIILNRWSPRAMTGEPIDNDTLMSFFEAARWAPSSMNNQVVRFTYAKRDTDAWQSFFDLLMEGNQVWGKDAAVLVIIISRSKSYYKDHVQTSHSFEAGAAFQNLALEATNRGYVAHPMGGFDAQKAHSLLKLTEDWTVDAMVAIGKYDAQKSREKEEKPSDRKVIDELVFEGSLPEGFKM